MKKKFLRSCFALLSMVLLFGGVKWDAAAIGDVSPFGPVTPTVPSINVNVTAPTSHIVVGSTLQLSCTSSPSGLSVLWSSTNTSVATVSSSGLVTAHSIGTTTITGGCYDSSTQKYVYDSVSISVCDSTGIPNNTEYYIMNCSNDRLMARETNTYTSTTDIATVTFSNASRAKWKTVKQSDGGFRLLSIDGTNNNRYLGISSSDAILSTGSYNFKICRITSGTYEGCYVIKYGNQYLSQNSSYDVCLTSSLSASCYWSFMKANKGWSRLYGFIYERKVNGNSSIYDSTEKFEIVKSYLNNMGYTSEEKVNLDTSRAYYFLQMDDMFIYAGHGERGRISFCDTDPNQRIVTGEIVKGTIIAHDYMNDSLTTFPNHHCINELPNNHLVNARCVLYLACRSGKSYTSSYGTYNLIDETFNKGAHFVLGATEKITEAHVDPWMEEFFASAKRGNSIEQCIEDADKKIGNITYNTDYGQGTCYGLPVYTRGDQKQYLSIGG